jgi:hypothetical protein
VRGDAAADRAELGVAARRREWLFAVVTESAPAAAVTLPPLALRTAVRANGDRAKRGVELHPLAAALAGRVSIAPDLDPVVVGFETGNERAGMTLARWAERNNYLVRGSELAAIKALNGAEKVRNCELPSGLACRHAGVAYTGTVSG